MAQHNTAFASILDKVAPLETRMVSFSKSSSWYTEELSSLKATGRRLERQYQKTGLTVHAQMYEQHQQEYQQALNAARTSYYSQRISNGSGNSRLLFSPVSKLLQPVNNFATSASPEMVQSIPVLLPKQN